MRTTMLNRRTMMSATALALMSPGVARRAAAAQSSAATARQSTTTEIFDRQVTWAAPWKRDESVKPVLQTALVDKRIDTVIGTLFYDSLVLQHPNEGFMEINFVPTPGAERSWDLAFRLGAQEVDIEIESESTDTLFYYGLRFFMNSGVEYGRMLKFTDPSVGVDVDFLVLSAPVAEFGATLQACQDSITIDGEPPFPMMDPGTVQSKLDPLIGMGTGATPEATPGT